MISKVLMWADSLNLFINAGVASDEVHVRQGELLQVLQQEDPCWILVRHFNCDDPSRSVGMIPRQFIYISHHHAPSEPVNDQQLFASIKHHWNSIIIRNVLPSPLSTDKHLFNGKEKSISISIVYLHSLISIKLPVPLEQSNSLRMKRLQSKAMKKLFTPCPPKLVPFFYTLGNEGKYHILESDSQLRQLLFQDGEVEDNQINLMLYMTLSSETDPKLIYE